MLNHVILVGRLVRTPQLVLTESGKKVSTVTLAVPRQYKNLNGEYDTDFLDCTLWTAIADATAEYCKTGDVIGVKGRLQSRIVELEDGTKYKRVDVIAEKVTFLSSARNNKDIKNVSDESVENTLDVYDLNSESVDKNIDIVGEESATYSKKNRKSAKKAS